jgi:hypothetical protein
MFCLQENQYVESVIQGQGFWFDVLNLGLGVWSGVYKGVEGQWLCWYDRSGNWIPSEQARILKAEQRAELLAAKLRELGIDVDETL